MTARHPRIARRPFAAPVALVFLAGLAAALLPALPAAGCSCARVPLEEHLATADLVFIGKVMKLEVLDETPVVAGEEIPGVDVILATVEVQEVTKGAVAPTVRFRTSNGCCYCAFHFTIGETYVLFAYETEDGTLSTSTCTPSAPLSEAEETLEVLRRGKWYPPT